MLIICMCSFFHIPNPYNNMLTAGGWGEITRFHKYQIIRKQKREEACIKSLKYFPRKKSEREKTKKKPSLPIDARWQNRKRAAWMTNEDNSVKNLYHFIMGPFSLPRHVMQTLFIVWRIINNQSKLIGFKFMNLHFKPFRCMVYLRALAKSEKKNYIYEHRKQKKKES